jgi:ADP-ribosylglycohydrolase
MTLPPSVLHDRFRAAVIGFAVGDALGFPYRGLPPQSMPGSSLADDFAPRPRGRFARGQFSDDTQVLLAMADSVAKERKIDGRSAAAHLCWLWEEGVILHPPASLTASVEQLQRGTPWMSAGAEVGVKDPSCLSRGVVVGLWGEESPSRLAHDAAVLTVLTHKDPGCAAAAAAVGRAVQLGMMSERLDPQQFCDELSKAAAGCDRELADEVYYLPRVLGWEPERALPALRKIGVPPAQLESPGLPSHVAPVLLTALYAALKVPHDFREAMAMVLRCGGESDVSAAVCGAMMGASLGCEAIPARLRKQVLYAEALVDAADRLFDARMARAQVGAAAVAVARRGA